MENKYYTPTLDEFHVGFEYEQKISSNHNEWQSVKISSPNQTESLDGVYKDDWDLSILQIEDCRVKYLDHKDLESEGWELNENNSRYGGQNQFDLCGGLWPKNGLRGWWLSINKNLTGPIKIQSTDEGMNIDGHNYSTKFYGTIKNISELRRLQKQLGIN